MTPHTHRSHDWRGAMNPNRPPRGFARLSPDFHPLLRHPHDTPGGQDSPSHRPRLSCAPRRLPTCSGPSPTPRVIGLLPKIDPHVPCPLDAPEPQDSPKISPMVEPPLAASRHFSGPSLTARRHGASLANRPRPPNHPARRRGCAASFRAPPRSTARPALGRHHDVHPPHWHPAAMAIDMWNVRTVLRFRMLAKPRHPPLATAFTFQANCGRAHGAYPTPGGPHVQ
jgi:hypothetical protein